MTIRNKLHQKHQERRARRIARRTATQAGVNAQLAQAAVFAA